MKKLSRRLMICFVILLCCFSVVWLRVFSLSQNERLQSAAQNQSTRSMVVSKTRAGIYDCRMEPLVQTEKQSVACVVPSEESEQALREYMDSIQYQTIAKQMLSRMPFVITLQDAGLFCKDIQVISATSRYSSNALAPHVVGYLDHSGTNGIIGIEKSYNDYLNQYASSIEVRYTTDAAGRVLNSDHPLIQVEDENKQAGVQLTLDSYMQLVCQKALRNSGKKGAVIILESETGKIRACASNPSFSQTNVADALNDPDGALLNRAFCAYPVGSTFKLCVTAGALENGISAATGYDCTGEVDVEGQLFHCHKREGHGWVDLKQAVTVSCNPYFIYLSSLLGKERLYKMASDFGFGRSDEVAPGMISAAGKLPKSAELKGAAALANLGFGQGDLMATPLQIAKMVSVFANGGRLVTPTIVEGLVDQQGDVTPYQAQGLSSSIITKETANTIKEYMINVVAHGSGIYARPKNMTAGGKTASAQTGVFDEAGNEIVHAWFAGFFPADTAQYTAVVLCENGGEGSMTAAPIFKEIADDLYYYLYPNAE